MLPLADPGHRAMRRSSSSAKSLKAGAPSATPTVPPVQTTVLIELALPLGIGLSSTNAVTDLQANADAQWQLGDRICWADGKEVRAGKMGVAQAIDRSRTVHTFVVQRWAPPTPGEVLITCRIHGDPGLGIGLTEKNAINQLTAGKPALLDGRLQKGDALVFFDGRSVEGGKAELSKIFDPSIQPHELVVRRKLPAPPAPTPGAKGKKPSIAPLPVTKATVSLALVDDLSEKDKKTGEVIKGLKMLPFALDKKGAVVQLDRECDELLLGDVIVSVDGKKVSGPLDMKAKEKLNKSLDAKLPLHAVAIERPNPYLTAREMSAAMALEEEAAAAAPPPPPPSQPAAAPPPSAAATTAAKARRRPRRRPPAARAPPPPPQTTTTTTTTATAATSSAASSSSAPGGAAARTFKSGWSNSAKTFKYVCDCAAGDGAPAETLA